MRKVLHAPVDIAGQMGVLCKELRNSGWEANGYNWFHTYLGYQSPLVHTDGYEVAKVIEQVFPYVDLVHFHNGNSLLQGFRDLPLLEKLGKKMIMHHWGSDVRNIEHVNQQQPFKLPPSYHTPEQIHRKLQQISSFIDTAIIQDHELYSHIAPYYKRIFILPLAIRTERFVPQYPLPANDLPLVVHAPTNSLFKGTNYVEAALNKLCKEIRFSYKRIEQMSHTEALAWYNKADVVIDQVLCGSYGLLSVEAMAMGKPVVAYLREDIRSSFPSPPPIVSADPSQLVETLRPLLQDAERRNELGRQGRAFTEAYHDVLAVVPQLIRIYEQL